MTFALKDVQLNHLIKNDHIALESLTMKNCHVQYWTCIECARCSSLS